jgi:hypothetical protein
MADDELFDLVIEWCEAKAKYDYENFPGGYPHYSTAHRLYHAGRALYIATGIEAADGRYSFNRYFEEPSESCKELLDGPTKIRNEGTDLENGQSQGIYSAARARMDNDNR